jgi:hypothetical protein
MPNSSVKVPPPAVDVIWNNIECHLSAVKLKTAYAHLSTNRKLGDIDRVMFFAMKRKKCETGVSKLQCSFSCFSTGYHWVVSPFSLLIK